MKYPTAASQTVGRTPGMKDDGTSVAERPRYKVRDRYKDRDWAIACMKEAIEEGGYYYDHREDMVRYLKAMEGDIDESLYSYVTDPYHTANDQFKNYPAKLRNYDIIEPVIRMLQGELLDAPDVPIVTATNPLESNTRLNEDFAFLRGIAAQHFINAMHEAGAPVEPSAQQVPDLKTAVDQMQQNHKSERVKYGQEALNFVYTNEKLKDKFQTAFYYFLVTGAVCLHVRVEHNDVKVEVINPIEIMPSGIPESGNLEDAETMVRYTKFSLSSIVDRWYDELDEEDLDTLVIRQDTEWAGNYVRFDAAVDTGYTSDNHPQMFNEDAGYIGAYHVVWKTFSDKYILYYEDNGREITTLVDQDYVLDEEAGDIKVEQVWINEIWEGWQLSEDVYVGIGPLDVQRTNINNLSECKMPYVGRFAGYTNGKIYSVVGMGLSYQVLYNIFHYRFELTMAKNKDKIQIMPLGLIPNKPGWDADKFMYFMDATGIAYIDESSPNAIAALQALKVMDLSLSQYAARMFEFMEAIKNEWWDVIGLNRQRYGATQASDGKGVTEQAISRSSMVTRDLFRQFGMSQEQTYEAIVDTSKVAFREGKKGMYIGSDGLAHFYEMHPDDAANFAETNYGIYVRDREGQSAKMEQLKALAQPFAQNGSMPSFIAKVIDADNPQRVIELLEEGEKIQQQLSQAMAEAEQAAEQAKLQADLQREQVKGEFAIKVAEIDATGKIQAAQIAANAKLTDASMKLDMAGASAGSDAGSSAADRANDRAKHRDEMSIKKAELAIKNKDIDTKYKIAKENKNKHDS